MNLLSLFSGIGAFERALQELGADFDIVNYCEVDPYASKAYSLLHNIPESRNLWDVRKVDCRRYPYGKLDLLTYGFPCQDISINGRKQGFRNEDGTTTRSGLFTEAVRIIRETTPKVAIAENVKNLLSTGMTEARQIVAETLNRSGYNSYWAVLNAQGFGIPQARERVFIVSIRKDLDDGSFTFPIGFPLTKQVADFLDAEVPEKFDIPESHKAGMEWRTHYENMDDPFGIHWVGNLNHYNYHKMNRVYSAYGSCATLDTVSGGGRAMKILAPDGRVRYLTPDEYFKLMGFTQEDVDLLRANGLSNSRLYKMAGNSIVVPVAKAVLKQVINAEFSQIERSA